MCNDCNSHDHRKCVADESPKTQWAIVELFGHQKIAGQLSEATIGGCSFVRVDVPPAGGNPGFTKMYGNGAIYAINFVSEDVARRAANHYEVRPVQNYELPKLPAGRSESEEDNL